MSDRDYIRYHLSVLRHDTAFLPWEEEGEEDVLPPWGEG
jgi:hypothetical protein